jgi:putative ABC transport system permease protein
VGVVNETFARQVFPNEDAIGKRVKLGGQSSKDPWITIVGVIRDFRHYRLPQPMGSAIYMPYAEGAASSQTFVIQTSRSDPLSLVKEVREALRETDPQVAAYDVKSIQDAVDESLARQRLQGQVLGLFAVLALLLTVVGIYGVISYTVAQRTREIGVRVALGAQRSNVIGMVLAHGARMAGAGIAIGLIGAFALSGTVASLLYGVKPTDLVTFVSVPLVLGFVTIAATYLPALRATRVDPLIAIRND